MPYIDIPQRNPEEEGMNTLHGASLGSPKQLPESFGALNAAQAQPQAPQEQPQPGMEAPAPSAELVKGPQDYKKEALRNMSNKFRKGPTTQSFSPAGLE